MPLHPQTTIRSALRIVTVLAIALSVRPSPASGQNVSGAIGVSLTILQPVATEPVKIVGVDVDRAGLATIALSAPVSGPASQVVMASVSSSTTNFSSEQQAPSTVRARGTPGEPVRFNYLVHVGRRASTVAERRPVELRIRYLAVAGT